MSSSPALNGLFLVSLACVACTHTTIVDDGTRDGADIHDALDVFATAPDAPDWAPDRRAFGVGLRSELRVIGQYGLRREISELHCLDDACTVESETSAFDGKTIFLITPKVADFTVHAEVARFGNYAPDTIERRVHAANGDFVVLHPGAGPSMPFVAGMHVVWYLGPRTRGIAWDSEQAKIEVTPPFVLAGGPAVVSGPDQDTFLRVEIVSTESTSVAQGSLTLTTGTRATSFPLIAVPRSDIAKLHLAPAPESLEDQRDAFDLPLDGIVVDRIEVPESRRKSAWLVFETKSGLFGLAGVGDCLPSADALDVFDVVPYDSAFYGFTFGAKHDVAPGDRPVLTLEGKIRGTGQLLLAAGDVTGSAQVIVTKAAF